MTSPSTDRRDAGFTIIEVLVALAVVAVSIVAIGSLMGVTRGAYGHWSSMSR
jgi:general secretion pathway protein I